MKTSALFLAIALVLPVLSVAQDVEQMGSWYYRASLDPITDVNSSDAFTVDDDEKWIMGVHCKDGGYGVAILTHPTSLNGSLLRLEILLETWKRTMTWRIDQTEPVIQNWLGIESGLTIQNKGAATFVEALMLAKNRIVMRFGHSTKTYTVILTADGAAEAIEALNNCN